MGRLYSISHLGLASPFDYELLASGLSAARQGLAPALVGHSGTETVHLHVPTLLGLISSLWHMAARITVFSLFGKPSGPQRSR